MPETADRLNQILQTAGLPLLDARQSTAFEKYLQLILRWNARVNLTAIRDEESILSRHFIESIACARALPPGIKTLLDFGSGAGFPGVPIAICRTDLVVTLAESQGKKGAFLQEVVRTLHLSASVFPERAETLKERFHCVTLRAVDRMDEAVAVAAQLVLPGGWLVLMTTSTDLPLLRQAAGPAFAWPTPSPLPGGEQRILAPACKGVSDRLTSGKPE